MKFSSFALISAVATAIPSVAAGNKGLRGAAAASEASTNLGPSGFQRLLGYSGGNGYNQGYGHNSAYGNSGYGTPHTPTKPSASGACTYGNEMRDPGQWLEGPTHTCKCDSYGSKAWVDCFENFEDEEGPADTPATDAPATDTPATDEPATDEPATDEPATDEPATDEPATDEPATDPPATDQPATDPPATDTPTTDTPATASPTAPAASVPAAAAADAAAREIVTVDWSFGVEQEEIELISQADTILFPYQGGHNVFQFADKESFDNCDFTNAIELCGRDETNCVVRPQLEPGSTVWYGCQVEGHCEFGSMKVAASMNA